MPKTIESNLSDQGPEMAAEIADRGLPLAAVCLASLTVCLVFLVTSPGGVRLALATSASSLLMFGVGYLVARAVGPFSPSSTTLAILAFPCGLIACCGLAQAFHACGLPRLALLTVIVLFALPGLYLAGRDSQGKWSARVPYGWWYIILVLLLGFSLYYPRAHTDSVYLKDGSVTWMHVDSPFLEAITDVLVDEKLPLRNPGFGKAPLFYHYGRHEVAACLATTFGLSVSDSINRSLHFLGLMGLTLACMGLGRATARRASDQLLAGLLAPCLACLPGAFAVFLDIPDPSARQPFTCYLPGLIGGELQRMLAEGFFTSGSSDLWGSFLLVTVAGLLSIHSQPQAAHAAPRLPWSALIVAVLGGAVNGLVAPVGVLVIAGWAFLRRPGGQALVFAAVAVAAFLAFRRILNMHHIQSAMSELRAGDLVFYLARLACMGFAVLFGFRALVTTNFVWGSRETKLAIVLFLSAFIGFDILFQIQSAYAILFLTVLLSTYAAAPLACLIESWRAGPQSLAAAMADCMNGFRSYLSVLLIVLCVFLPLSWFPFVRHFKTESIYGFSIILAIALPVAAVAYGLLVMAARRSWTPNRGQAALALAVMLGLSLAGFVRRELGWAWDWLGVSVAVDAKRVESLEYVRGHVPSGAMLATVHHNVDVRETPQRSYVYSALSHRYFLVEGWYYGWYSGEASAFPGFDEILRENDLIFKTADPEIAKKIVRKYGVTHLLVEPGESLTFDATKAEWLHPLANPGSLSIYEVDPQINGKQATHKE